MDQIGMDALLFTVSRLGRYHPTIVVGLPRARWRSLKRGGFRPTVQKRVYAL
jgi:hypothetical protein